MKKLLIFINLLSLFSASLSCPLLNQAFSTVANFQLLDNITTCTQIQELSLSSKNLTGTISWKLLKNISTLRSIDLSHNSLQGSIPGDFFSSSPLVHLNLAFNRLGGPLLFQTTPSSSFSLQTLNLSNNRFTNAVGNISSFSNLQTLDLSHNNLSFVPPGLQNLHSLSFLDVSYNSMSGVFPNDFPMTNSLRLLNVSFNNLTGNVNSTMVDKFGRSAFINAGHSISFGYSSSKAKKYHPHQRQRKKHNPSRSLHGHKLVIIICVTTSTVVAALGVLALCCLMKMRKKKKGAWKDEEKRVKEEEEVPSWVGESRWGAPVVVF